MLLLVFPQSNNLVKRLCRLNMSHTHLIKSSFLKNVTFTLERGDKVALIAPNGAGKTTLFNLISGNYPLQNGKITFGHNVKFAVFDQDQTAALPLEKTIIEAIEESSPRISQQVIRTTLGAFLFSNEDVNKKIKVLSGGEKNRVGMIKILLQDANLLLLDEPTNHLDIPSKEVLLKALQQYHGTILFVSHDQDFINELATKILELTPSGALLYQGNYDTYRYHKQLFEVQYTEAKNNHVQEQSKPKKIEAPETQKKIRLLERQIDTLEKSMKKVEQSFIDLQYGTPEFVQAQEKLKKLTKEYDEVIQEWERLQS